MFFPMTKVKKKMFRSASKGRIFTLQTENPASRFFVVDGLEVASIDTLSPDRIASVTVLKDASAEALYGEKGRNGVVVVSTKDAAGGARDYSVDAEDGSVKVVVRGSGKMSDVRVVGSSTVPADKADRRRCENPRTCRVRYRQRREEDCRQPEPGDRH